MRITANRLAILAALCFISFGRTGTVWAASFDCAKAQSKVEHMICDNPEISKLDEELAQSYKAALQDKIKAQKIRQDQRLWIKQRDNCADIPCVKQIFENRLSVLLDEEMEQKYKAAMQDKTKAQKIKQEQELWIAQRDNCEDVACVNEIFEIRLSELKRLLSTPPDPNTRYLMIHGKGQAICEQVLKQMNYGPQVCASELLASIPGVVLPEWKKLDLKKNKLLYKRFLVAQMVREDYYPKLFGGSGNMVDAIPIPTSEQMAKGGKYVLRESSDVPITDEMLDREWQGSVENGNEFFRWDGAMQAPDETDVILVESSIHRNLGGCPTVRMVRFSADMRTPKPWLPLSSEWFIAPGQISFKFDSQYYSVYEESGFSRDSDGVEAIRFRTLTISDGIPGGHYCNFHTNYSFQPQ